MKRSQTYCFRMCFSFPHAGIHSFHPTGIIRVGGRSSSALMKECSLRNLKYKMHQEKTGSREIRRAFYDAHCEMEFINERMQRATESLQHCMENIVHEDELQESGIMTEQQYTSLLRRPGLSRPGRKKASALLKWLNLINTYMDPHETSELIHNI